jgi:hypothetical protein
MKININHLRDYRNIVVDDSIAENLLTGHIGTASARILISSVLQSNATTSKS